MSTSTAIGRETSRVSKSRSKACIPCQKQKVRCLLNNDQNPCQRCAKRGIKCIFRRAPPYWKPRRDETFESMVTEDLSMMHTAINNILASRYQPALGPLRTKPNGVQNCESSSPPASAPASAAAEDMSPAMDHLMSEQFDTPTNDGDPVASLNQAPIKSLYEITRLESLRSRQLSPVSFTDEPLHTRTHVPRDIISKGKVSIEDATILVQAFLDQTDHYLYGIMAKFQDMNSIRCASTLLFTAICTVSALHSENGENLYQLFSLELRSLISNFVFTPRVNIEDFQGLCISSFWLSEISWSVSGLGVRRAVEFQLVKSFDIVVGDKGTQEVGASSLKIQLGSQSEALDCLRVWYLLYMCDHHLSILYGRPLGFGDQTSMEKWESYLASVPESSTDTRLASQIDLLLILSKVSRLFGVRNDRCIPTTFQPQLEAFNSQLDQWLITWSQRSQPHGKIGNFPQKALDLHYHFSKLFVSSHVFHGRTSHSDEGLVPIQYSEMARIAVNSAKAITELVTQDEDIKSGLVSMPHYYHTMIAYACSFLLKLAASHHNHLDIQPAEIFNAIHKVAHVCKSTRCTRYHLVHWMGTGLHELAAKCEGALSLSTVHHPSDTDVQGNSDTSRQRPNEQPQQDIFEDNGGILAEPSNAWDAARQAASYHWEIPPLHASLSNDSPGIVGPTLGSDAGLLEAELEWESLLPSFNLEHMGLGLL